MPAAPQLIHEQVIENACGADQFTERAPIPCRKVGRIHPDLGGGKTRRHTIQFGEIGGGDGGFRESHDHQDRGGGFHLLSSVCSFSRSASVLGSVSGASVRPVDMSPVTWK